MVGRQVLVDNYPMTVIGIAPAGFTGMDPHRRAGAVDAGDDVAARGDGSTAAGTGVLDRRAAWMHVFARLKPGMTIETAQAGLKPWFSAMLEQRVAPRSSPRT